MAFKKKGRKGPANLRKRALEADEDEAEVKATVAAGLAAQQVRKKARLSTNKGGDNEQSAHEQILASLVKSESAKPGDGRIIASSRDDKAAKKDTSVAFGTSGVAGSIQSNDATRTIDVDGHTGADKNSKRFGPMRAPSNVRVTCRFDYQQDICKDFKETGYCGYGDSCIFLHDRGDYKTGWQLEREWEGKMNKLTGARDQDLEIDPNTFEVRQKGQDTDSDDDDIPDECPICDEPFTNPVVTACGHYFDEACALKHERTGGGKCYECNAKTNGNFKVAKGSVGKDEKEQEQKKKEEPSDDDDDNDDSDRRR